MLGNSYPFRVDIYPLVSGALQIDGVQTTDGDGQDELEEVQDGEGEIARGHAKKAHFECWWRIRGRSPITERGLEVQRMLDGVSTEAALKAYDCWRFNGGWG